VENNQARFGVRDLQSFCHGAGKYLMMHKQNITGLIHSTHLTEDEKRIKRNKQAVARRVKAKKKL
jgi:hypothetical protein